MGMVRNVDAIDLFLQMKGSSVLNMYVVMLGWFMRGSKFSTIF